MCPDFDMAVTVGDVARDHNLRPEQLTGRRRTVEVVEARREAIKQCYQQGFSSLQVGRFFGRHHTTILAYLGRVA